jgi:hypothetical protein
MIKKGVYTLKYTGNIESGSKQLGNFRLGVE